jgi:hypothetical protein
MYENIRQDRIGNDSIRKRDVVGPISERWMNLDLGDGSSPANFVYTGS